MSKFSGGNTPKLIADKLNLAFAALLEAFDYSLDADADPWDFAVSIIHLREVGLNDSDLRWLVRKGYVNHAVEVTAEGTDGRAFRSSGNLTFTPRTSFVLTDAGVAKARRIGEIATTNGQVKVIAWEDNWQAAGTEINWDGETRKLRVNGMLVKCFKWPAANQEAVLSAFQEEGWPDRIDDPLPPLPEQDPKRRLSDTIKCLNRRQTKHLIHFHGDGTGEGVVWEIVRPNSETE